MRLFKALKIFCIKTVLAIACSACLTSMSVSAGEGFSSQKLRIIQKGCSYRMTYKDGGYNFQTSKNNCHSMYKQRNELTTPEMPISTKGFFVFETDFSMKSERPSEFVIFQMHDATAHGCAPPLIIKAMPFGTYTKFDNTSNYGKVKFLSKAVCTPSDFTNLLLKDDFNAGEAQMKFDGTPIKLRAEVALDGTGDYELSFYVDNQLVIEGSYTAAHKMGFTRSKSYYFKHGAYSKNLFKYTARTTPVFLRYPYEAKETIRLAAKPFGESTSDIKPAGCSDAAFAEMMGEVCK